MLHGINTSPLYIEAQGPPPLAPIEVLPEAGWQPFRRQSRQSATKKDASELTGRQSILVVGTSHGMWISQAFSPKPES